MGAIISLVANAFTTIVTGLAAVIQAIIGAIAALLFGIFNVLTCGFFAPAGRGVGAAAGTTDAAVGAASATPGGRWFGVGGKGPAGEAQAEQEAVAEADGLPPMGQMGAMGPGAMGVNGMGMNGMGMKGMAGMNGMAGANGMAGGLPLGAGTMGGAPGPIPMIAGPMLGGGAGASQMPMGGGPVGTGMGMGVGPIGGGPVGVHPVAMGAGGAGMMPPRGMVAGGRPNPMAGY